MKRKYVKQIGIFVSVWIMSMAATVPAGAALPSENREAPVWKRNEQGWWVENPDGSYYTNIWYPSNGLWYYLGADGYMLTNTITPDGYPVGEDGAWITNTAANRRFAVTGCSTIRDDFSRSTRNGRALYCYFDRVVFEGTDNNRIQWLNTQVENVEAQFKEEYLPLLQDYLSKLQNNSYNETYYIFPHQIAHVYSDDTYVSIGWECDWYAGGVDDCGYIGLNLNTATQSHVSLTDVLGANAYDKIVDAVDRQGYSGVKLRITRNMLDEIHFYFDADAVYFSLDPGLFFGFTGGAEIIRIPR